MRPIWIAGVDEAGRGPLAGPVYAAAVILDPAKPVAGLADSKKLTAAKREALFDVIRQNAKAWAIASASVDEIDAINILQASLLAMRRAVQRLATEPRQILVDGLHCPNVSMPARATVKGDSKEPAISAASILAKVARDRDMLRLHAQYPHYRFDLHKGYGTALHLAALGEHGVSPAHRRSYAPIKKLF
ncbi:MAG: ribonuclease HII [Betaproteobacteria bacterium]|nr:ribonuclease HII [Betaproteobacteria bacterium]